MSDTFEKAIKDLTEDSVFETGYSDSKEVSGPKASDERESDVPSEWKDKYCHLLADLDNTKKRMARISSLEVENLNTELLRDVLPVSDGLDLVLAHISNEDDSLNILQGIEGVRDILDKFFVKYHVTAIDARGEVFDPNLHEAIGMVQHTGLAPNTVERVERKGFLYQGKLLRPAQVLVAAEKKIL